MRYTCQLNRNQQMVLCMDDIPYDTGAIIVHHARRGGYRGSFEPRRPFEEPIPGHKSLQAFKDAEDRYEGKDRRWRKR